MATLPTPQKERLFGHPAGLYTLFFAEMWERFSYYGMRALLVFYMVKGFLGYTDDAAYTVYGAYTALVYMTPFFGGIIADRLLGQRRAVIFGAILMATGQALLMVSGLKLKELGGQLSFYGGLAFLIAGNGFFKPNISAIVGSLYEKHDMKRDGGFTIFYMGINLGAAMSPLLCGYVGETYGWHWGFGLATLGMVVGLAVFVAPRVVTQALILIGSLSAALGLLQLRPDSVVTLMINVFVALALLTAAVVAVVAIARGGLPDAAGAAPDLARLRRRVAGPLSAEWLVYLGTFLLIPLFLLLVSGFAPFSGKSVAVVPAGLVASLEESDNVASQIAGVLLKEVSTPAGLILSLSFLGAFGYLGFEAVRLDRVARQRMYVVFILTFFSLLFWAFFEQAGSSVNNFTDRNVDRVFDTATRRVIGLEDIGKTIALQPTQEQLGYENGSDVFTIGTLNDLRKKHDQELKFTIDWRVVEQNVGMKIAERDDEIPASLLQAANPVYILVFGLLFTALWAFLNARGLEPSTPLKFSLGLLQLGLGFGAFWLGAQSHDARGMVFMGWLLAGYLLHTTGELCLSPVGLSMVTRLSPQRLVATVMGAWFLATAISQFLAAIIAKLTSVEVAAPIKTVDVYGDVFGGITIAALASAAICFALVPLLKKWMHEGDQS